MFFVPEMNLLYRRKLFTKYNSNCKICCRRKNRCSLLDPESIQSCIKTEMPFCPVNRSLKSDIDFRRSNTEEQVYRNQEREREIRVTLPARCKLMLRKRRRRQ